MSAARADQAAVEAYPMAWPHANRPDCRSQAAHMLPGVSTLGEPLTRALGPKTAKALEAAFGMRTVGDLLRHYPRRYYTRGELTDLSSLREGDHVTVLARVEHVGLHQMYGKGPNAGRAEVVITDDRAKLVLTFFFRNRRRAVHHQAAGARHGRHVRRHRVPLPHPAAAGPPGVRDAARRAAERRPHAGAGGRVRRRDDPGLPGQRQGQLVDDRPGGQDRAGPAGRGGGPAARPSSGSGTGWSAGPRRSAPSTGRSTRPT